MKKRDILRHIKDYQAFIKTQTGKNLKSCEIQYEITAAHLFAQNGTAKCLNRTLIEHTHAMMLCHILEI